MTLVLELLKQNQEFKDLMVEQSKQLVEQQQQLIEQQHQNSKLLEAVKDGKLGSTINNTTNNNKFNLNVFLNETCKDAITMDDFIKSFEVTREDFIRTGNVGFIEGISTVMLSRFRNMETHTRPLHCTDLKRETVYIKNADKWEKEDANKTQLRRAVKVVAHRNMNELWRWYNDNKPEVEQIGTDECENYFKYYKAALGGCGKEEDLKFEEKIIKNVLKEVQVDKNMLTISD
jgi:SAM-dependent MidA family methyltransferase